MQENEKQVQVTLITRIGFVVKGGVLEFFHLLDSKFE